MGAAFLRTLSFNMKNTEGDGLDHTRSQLPENLWSVQVEQGESVLEAGCDVYRLIPKPRDFVAY